MQQAKFECFTFENSSLYTTVFSTENCRNGYNFNHFGQKKWKVYVGKNKCFTSEKSNFQKYINFSEVKNLCPCPKGIYIDHFFCPKLMKKWTNLWQKNGSIRPFSLKKRRMQQAEVECFTFENSSYILIVFSTENGRNGYISPILDKKMEGIPS